MYQNIFRIGIFLFIYGPIIEKLIYLANLIVSEYLCNELLLYEMPIAAKLNFNINACFKFSVIRNLVKNNYENGILMQVSLVYYQARQAYSTLTWTDQLISRNNFIN